MVPRTCTSLLFASLLLLRAVAGLRRLRRVTRPTLFSCLRAGPVSITIELCAVRDDAAGGYQSLQYRYGTRGQGGTGVPGGPARRARRTCPSPMPSTRTPMSGRCASAMMAIPIASLALGDEAGVEVWKKKKRLAQVMCGERPYGHRRRHPPRQRLRHGQSLRRCGLFRKPADQASDTAEPRRSLGRTPRRARARHHAGQSRRQIPPR